MRLPGTRYQEHGWEQVRKLLGQCSLLAFAHTDFGRLGEALGQYVDDVSFHLRAHARSARAQADGNSYGESVFELAQGLVFELQARPADWQAFAVAVGAEPQGDAILRKKVNDMYAVLRDKVDADNYQVACGRACSANKIYAYRMLDTAYADIARIFEGWRERPEEVGAILGRPIEGLPIEVRQMKSVGDCKSEWVLNWSESRERFTGSPGPLHTKSKRFANLKTSVDKIAAMLREIGDYQELSSNRDSDADWLGDLARVLAAPEGEGPDQLLEAVDDDFLAPEPQAETDADDPRLFAIAASVSLPPRFMQMALAATPKGMTMAGESLPVRLAVYLKMLGAADDSYPDEWCDPATGELPTMQQLAALDQISLPTLRKRRDAAIASLLERRTH